MQDTPHATRLHALDAVRAVALLLGVALHAALSYAPGVDSHLWPLADSQKGVVMSVGTFLIHIFRMPVFFLMASFFAKASPVIRYLSGASYWMYIAHLPVVMAMQTLLMPFDQHWSVKFLAVNTVTFAVLLLTYRYCERSSWLGQMLNGRKLTN